MLEIYLLGVPRVVLDGELFNVSRKITRALLFYLAAQPKGIQRSLLAERFWEDEPESVQNNRLRTYLSNIRKIDKSHKFVITHLNSISLDPDFVQVDVLELYKLVEDIQRNKGRSIESASNARTALYQRASSSAKDFEAEGFIESTDLDNIPYLTQWQAEERAAIRKEQEILFTFLAESASDLALTNEALDWAIRALKYGENETIYYVLIKSLRDLGQFDEAQQRYQEAEEILWDGLSSRIQTLGEDLAHRTEASVPHVRSAWSASPNVDAPFVGRSEIIEKMQVNYQRGIASLLVGDVGAGKTRLVQRFYQKLPAKPNVLLIPCYKDSEHLPYQPWTDMLRSSFTADFWRDTPARWTTPLTTLLPDIHQYRDDLDVRPSDSFASGVVFEAVKQLLEYAAQQGTILLFVEDAQWLDSISFSLLEYLITHGTFQKWNIGLVATSRPNRYSDRDFDAMRGKLQEIKLPPLARKAIKELALFSLYQELTADNILYLEKLTGGNPFFLLELLNYQASHLNEDIFDDSTTTPKSVRQLIAVRLNALTAPARQALSYAAVQGNHFSLPMLEETIELSMEDMVPIIEELSEKRLVEHIESDADLSYAFVHEKIREEILNAQPQVERRFMHARTAKVLADKKRYKKEQASVLAEHYECAKEFEKAFYAWFEAAQHAYRVFSKKDAHAAYQRAEKMLALISLPDESLYQFYASWGFMLYFTDDPDAIEAVMKRFLAYGKAQNSLLLIGAALDGLSDVYFARNEYQEGLNLVEEALTYLITIGHIPAQMNAFIHQGVFFFMLNDFPASLDSFEIALSLTKGRDDPHTLHVLGNAHYQKAISLVGMGYPSEAIEQAKKSLHYTYLAEPPHMSVLPYSIMGFADYYLGYYKKGKEESLRSLKIALKTDVWRMSGYAAAYAGFNETELPELENAWQHAHEAIQRGEEHGHTEIIAMGYKIIGDIYTRLEAPVQAVQAYQRGLAVDKNSFVTLENAARLGVTLGLVGDPNADALLEDALHNAGKAGLEIIEFNARALQLSLFIARKDYQRFDQEKSAIRKILTERSHPKSHVWTDYLQAQRLYQEEQLQEALNLLEKTLTTLDETEFFWIDLRARRLHYHLLKALQRDTSQPRAKITEMLEKIENGLGSAPLQDEWRVFKKRIKKELA